MRPKSATQDFSQHVSALSISLSRRDSSHVDSPGGSIQHLADMLVDGAPTEACAAIIPSTHLHLDDGTLAICYG